MKDIGKISVIIPCYNVEKYVGECVRSIIAQNYDNLEIICINDGSHDSTYNILHSLQNVDSRIIVINQNNKGISESRNIGINMSTGEHVMFVDSDDYLSTNTLKEVNEVIENAELICFSYNRIFANNVKRRKLNFSGSISAKLLQRRLIGLIGRELYDPSATDSLVTVWGKIYRGKIIREKKIKFFDTTSIGSCEDLLFNLEYLNYVQNVKILDLPFYNYRKINGNSYTSLYRPDLFIKWNNLFNYIEKFTKNDLDNRKALLNRIALSIIGLGLNETFSNKTKTEQKKRLFEILNSPRYRQAYQNLEMKHFPIHWRLFFTFAKYKLVAPLLFMLNIIKSKVS